MDAKLRRENGENVVDVDIDLYREILDPIYVSLKHNFLRIHMVLIDLIGFIKLSSDWKRNIHANNWRYRVRDLFERSENIDLRFLRQAHTESNAGTDHRRTE